MRSVKIPLLPSDLIVVRFMICLLSLHYYRLFWHSPEETPKTWPVYVTSVTTFILSPTSSPISIFNFLNVLKSFLRVFCNFLVCFFFIIRVRLKTISCHTDFQGSKWIILSSILFFLQCNYLCDAIWSQVGIVLIEFIRWNISRS